MKFSPRKVFWNDWPTLAASIGVPIVWGIHFAFPLLKKTSEPPLLLSIALSLVLIAVTIWRFKRINYLFDNGKQTAGIIEDIIIAKDRGRLIYAFQVDGDNFSSWHPIHKNKQILSMFPGQAVTVIYDPTNPRFSIVKDLFDRISEAEQGAAANPYQRHGGFVLTSDPQRNGSTRVRTPDRGG